MRVKNCTVKNVSANIVKGEIVVSFSLDFSDLETAEQIAQLVNKEGAQQVMLDITPRQASFFKDMKDKGETE